MRIIMFIFLILAVSSLSAQTLEDYLQIAIKNNPGIKAKQTEFQAALQKIPQAKSLPEPTVNATWFIQPMMLPMGNQLGSISAMQMFPWFGALDAMENEAASMAEVKLQVVQVAQNELFFKIKNAWFPLFELEEQISIQQDLLRLLKTDMELATVMFQQGMAPMVDPIRADIMIDEVNTEIALLQQKRKPLEVAFNLLLNREDSSFVAISGFLPEPLPGMFARRDTLIVNNPMLTVFDKQIQAAIAEEKVAEYMRKPMIGAGLQYMPLAKRTNNDIPPNTGMDMVMPMFSATVPIWNKKYNAAVEERRLMQVMYADMKLDMANDLAAMYEMTFYELEKMAQMIELLNLQTAKTQQAINLVLAAYSNAGMDFEEVLRLQQQLFRYLTKKVSAQTEYQLQLAKLDYLTGKMN